MESLQSILLAISLGDWMLSVDLSDAYLHIPIHPAFQKFLRFAINHCHFQFRCLPFGISSAPRTFTKVLLPLVAFLRGKGLRIHHYLDDILLLAKSQELLLQHREILLSTLHDFGWIVNLKKSSLQPTQKMVFLGAHLDTELNRVQLPQAKIQLLIQKMRRLLSASHLSARVCLSMLGSMSATIPMVQWSQWHMRTLQNSFLKQWNGVSMHQTIVISRSVKRSVWWWTHQNNLEKYKPIVPPDPEVVTSDACQSGWGGHYQDLAVQGQWQFQALGVVSNILELRAAFHALTAFTSLLSGKSVLIRMDNKVAVSYVQRQGGTRSVTLMEEVRPILEWAQVHLTDLRAVYVPATQNALAKYLSRKSLSNNEWSLSPQIFSLLTETWGTPEIDLAATPLNTKCHRFLSRNPSPSAEGIDCLIHPWNFKLGYIFPPTPLIARFLSRLRRSSVTIIAVIPFWPRRPWFTTLLQLSVQPPILLPLEPDLFSQGQSLHPAPERLHLMAWKLKGLG
ncbi:ubiquitin-conjugating enzyme E2 U isoform X1 [Lithobates pipiens]